MNHKNKFLLTIIACLLLAVCSAFGQDAFNIHLDTIQTKICNERGHIRGSAMTSTLMHCPSYHIDYQDSTVMVYPSCNYVTFTCKRCLQEVSEKAPERRSIIWERKKQNKR